MSLEAAKRYLQRARDYERVARWGIENPQDGKIRIAPCLHLIAHGFELLLKAILAASGISENERRNVFKHDLEKMWKHHSNYFLRSRVHAIQNEILDRAFNQKRLNQRPFADFEAQLFYLSDLHKGTQSLRYPDQTDTMVNSPPFLCDMLSEMMEEQAKRY